MCLDPEIVFSFQFKKIIGIEKDEKYFNIAVKRIKGTEPKPNNFEKVEERGLFSFTDEQNKAD